VIYIQLNLPHPWAENKTPSHSSIIKQRVCLSTYCLCITNLLFIARTIKLRSKKNLNICWVSSNNSGKNKRLRKLMRCPGVSGIQESNISNTILFPVSSSVSGNLLNVVWRNFGNQRCKLLRVGECVTKAYVVCLILVISRIKILVFSIIWLV